MVMSTIEANIRTTQWVSIERHLVRISIYSTLYFSHDENSNLFISLFFLVSEIINKESPTKYEALTKGILFHKELQILLAEKIVNLEFLVPFPQYDFVMKQQIEDMLEKLATMWTEPSILCPVNFSEPFNSSNKPFNLVGCSQKSQIRQNHQKTKSNICATLPRNF